MITNARLLQAAALLVAGFALIMWVKLRPIKADTPYIGSASCQACHRKIFEAWSDSLHTKMMRPADAPGVTIADFDVDDGGLRFDREDAVWAIGGKWEQQFMGDDGETETLLPGAWHRTDEVWDFKGWDGWQVPVPLRRCHGCHTVGLDVEAGTFVEPNIGCESCHGPGSWHAQTYGLGRIHSSADAEVCGQCHTRGRAPSGDYFFPVGYRPGDDLSKWFIPEEPSPGQNSTYWWGNGHERKRHQEYFAWSQGGHADSLERLRSGYDGRFGEVSDDCMECHSAESEWNGAQNGVTCSVCHNVHGSLDQARASCASCHGNGAYHHQPEANADHVPCPEAVGVSCVDCHMPKTAIIGGQFAIHSHRAGFVQPADAERFGMPTGCANGGCHIQDSPEELQARFNRHYHASDHPLTGTVVSE